LLPKKQIINRKEPIVINYINKKDLITRVYLYKVYINEISDIMLNSEIIPFDRLQLGEVDWAGFLTKEESMPKIFHRVKHLLLFNNIN
jgi:hypothetical protein